MPAAAIVAVALAVTAVVGLIVGAIWGQMGGDAPSVTPAPTAVVTPTTPSASAAPTGTAPGDASPTPSTTGGTPTDTGSPAASPTGSAPPAPATTTTSADGWRLGSWRITTTGGTLGVDTTARNTTTGTRSATLVLYVYVNGALIATTTAVVTDVPAGGTVPVHFAGTDPWQAGTKILLLATA
jgi:hypothetical protein